MGSATTCSPKDLHRGDLVGRAFKCFYFSIKQFKKHQKAFRHHQSDLLDLAQRACAVKSQGSGIENGFGNSQIVASGIFRTHLVIVTAFYTLFVLINAIHSGSRYSVFSPSKLGEPPRRIKLGNPAAMKSIYKTRYSVRLRRQGMLLQYLKNDYQTYCSSHW
jgi:hypothetical protein